MKLGEIKPKFQERVHYGSAAQKRVEDHLEDNFGSEYDVISSSAPASSAPDLIAKVNDDTVQFEIKGQAHAGSYIKFYEKSLGRGDRDRVFDNFAKTHSGGKYSTFSELIDKLKENKPSVGFPGDEEVAKSGSVWLVANDRSVLSKLRSYVINYLRSENNNYFVVYDRSKDSVSIYFTGYGRNPLSAPRIPNFKQVLIDTYGGAYKNKMRVALKIKI